jgi:hypothetical protein
MQRYVTVNSGRQLRWALATDLGWGRRPKLHGMQVFIRSRTSPYRPGARENHLRFLIGSGSPPRMSMC